MNDKPTVYIETTIPSYLTARSSENVCALSRQIITRKWWLERKSYYHLFISDVVMLECQKGDPIASQQRIELISEIDSLEITDECAVLAEGIFYELQIPDKARDDSLHISLAAVHKVDYLLSWNFRHIVNAALIKKLNAFLMKENKHIPQFCTPEELMT